MKNGDKYHKLAGFIKELYPSEGPVPLHAPVFMGNEKEYLAECIDSTFVSYVGRFVGKFEQEIQNFTKAKYAIATVNGTSALHIALLLAGVKTGDEVLTQALTFVATTNAIKYCNADPVFIDCETAQLGMNPDTLEEFLYKNTSQGIDGFCYNKVTGKRISACVPVHIFGHPARLSEITTICKKYNVKVVEDAAEALGSYIDGIHCGIMSDIGILSFNGNKIVTTGGGGMILTNNESLATQARHITTTARVIDQYNFFHDQTGFNYRMTNLNAAVGFAQMEYIHELLSNKRETANAYNKFCDENGIEFFGEKTGYTSNFWLNTIFLENRTERDEFLHFTNSKGIMTRPAWTLMPDLPMYKNCQSSSLQNARNLADRIVNLPSSYRKV
ncbi:MAG: LegC family aminotransferase [Lentimicrobium sp.]|nr:LegC family aminotransferase [Lentimicrobium sp.]